MSTDTRVAEVVWVFIAEDKKRKGELIGWIAEGEEKGKIVFFTKQPDPDNCTDGEFAKVELKENDREKKFARGLPPERSFSGEGAFGRMLADQLFMAKCYEKRHRIEHTPWPECASREMDCFWLNEPDGVGITRVEPNEEMCRFHCPHKFTGTCA